MKCDVIVRQWQWKECVVLQFVVKFGETADYVMLSIYFLRWGPKDYGSWSTGFNQLCNHGRPPTVFWLRLPSTEAKRKKVLSFSISSCSLFAIVGHAKNPQWGRLLTWPGNKSTRDVWEVCEERSCGYYQNLVVSTHVSCVSPVLWTSLTIQQTPCSCSVIGPSYSTHLYTRLFCSAHLL